MSNVTEQNINYLYNDVAQLIEQSRKRVAVSINKEISMLYWNIGNTINQHFLENKRAAYGKQVIAKLSKELTLKYGKGFNETNLRNSIKFAEVYPQIPHSLSEKLTWTHIRTLIYIEDETKREFYISDQYSQ